MSKLDGTVAYLSGPMQFASDDGVMWRHQLKQLSRQVGLNISYIDPTAKAGQNHLGQFVKTEKAHCAKLRKQGKWNQVQKFVKTFRRFDLRSVDLASLIIVHIDTNVHMCGTYDELFVAERQQKPILIICKNGFDGLPDWLFGAIELDNVFTSVNDCIDYLVALDNGTVEMNNKWILLGKHLGVTI